MNASNSKLPGSPSNMIHIPDPNDVECEDKTFWIGKTSTIVLSWAYSDWSLCFNIRLNFPELDPMEIDHRINFYLDISILKVGITFDIDWYTNLFRGSKKQ